MLIIKNGKIIDPIEDAVYPADLYVKDGVIARIVRRSAVSYTPLYDPLPDSVLKEQAGKASEFSTGFSILVPDVYKRQVWKASAPARRCMHWCIRQVTRVKNCGSMKGVAAKIKYKQHEKHAMEQFGTKSFPDEARREAEQNTDFPRRVKISILVPLFNTPEEFLREMIDSVMNQTYSNWELCLADGSDDVHAYVAEVVREYEGKADGRIVYHRLLKNEGIAGNTNEFLKLATG